MTTENLIEVYCAKDGPQAHLLKAALEDAGISARVEGDQLQSALGELPLGWPTAPRILVLESDAEKARKILEQLESLG